MGGDGISAGGDEEKSAPPEFEQWLLLATRCLVLALLGLALARPLGCADNRVAALAAERTGFHVFVIDNSYSMAYEADRPDAKTHLDQAKKIAKARSIISPPAANRSRSSPRRRRHKRFWEVPLTISNPPRPRSTASIIVRRHRFARGAPEGF
jgi:hypothetical protein